MDCAVVPARTRCRRIMSAASAHTPMRKARVRVVCEMERAKSAVHVSLTMGRRDEQPTAFMIFVARILTAP